MRGPATRGRRPVRFQGNVSNNQYYYVWENIDDNRVYYMTLEDPPTFNDTTAVRQQTRSAQFESWWRVVTDCSSASDTHCASLAPTEWLVEDEPRFEQAHPVTRPSMAEGDCVQPRLCSVLLMIIANNRCYFRENWYLGPSWCILARS